MLHLCVTCILYGLKTLGSDSAHSWMAFGGTFCDMGPGFGTLRVNKESQSSEPEPWTLFTGQVFPWLTLWTFRTALLKTDLP